MFRSFLHKKRGCHSILLPAAGCGKNPVANPGNPLDRSSVRSLKTLLAALVLYIFLADLVVGKKNKNKSISSVRRCSAEPVFAAAYRSHLFTFLQCCSCLTFSCPFSLGSYHFASLRLSSDYFSTA